MNNDFGLNKEMKMFYISMKSKWNRTVYLTDYLMKL